MRPEDDADEWRTRIQAAVHIEGLPSDEAADMAARFASVYVEKGGRRCLDDSTPFIELRLRDDGLLDFTFEDESWLVDPEGPGGRVEAVESWAADAARESRLWW